MTGLLKYFAPVAALWSFLWLGIVVTLKPEPWATLEAVNFAEQRWAFPPPEPVGPFAGVDLYVIEISNTSRVGKVGQQALKYGVRVEIVPAHTPSHATWKVGMQQMQEECRRRRENEDKLPREQKPPPNEASYKITPIKIACTLSHLEALKRACDKPKRQAMALVLEDDANFEPVPWWPKNLRTMVSTLPQQWTIVSAACSNENDPISFGQPGFFRNHTGIHDFGAVAVLYHLNNPVLCPLIQKYLSVWDFYQNTTHPCQPADMLIYSEFRGPVSALTSKMPLFFSSQDAAQADLGAMNKHFSEHALAQREAWAKYRQLRNHS